MRRGAFAGWTCLAALAVSAVSVHAAPDAAAAANHLASEKSSYLQEQLRELAE